MQARAPDAPSASTHRVAAGWKWFVALVFPVLAGLCAWALLDIIDEYRTGREWDNVWRFGLVLAILGGLVLFSLASVILIFRARVVLNGETLAVRGLFRTRVIAAREFDGYRWINGGLHLYLKGDQWPLNLTHYEGQGELIQWVSSHAPDLGALELARENQEIRRDPTLGMMESQKEAELARLRGLASKLNWVAYLGAAVFVPNAFLLEDPTVEKLAGAVLAAMPVGALVLASLNPGHVRFDYREGTRYPQVLTGILTSGLALGLVSLLDPHTLLGDAFYRWLVPVAVVNGLLWIVMESRGIRDLYQRGWLLAAITVASFFLLSAGWAGGAIYQINKNFDESEPTWSPTTVVGKRTESLRTGTSYYLKVEPWDAPGGEPLELSVSKAQYGALDIGAQVEVGVRGGALEIPWVADVRRLGKLAAQTANSE